MDGEEVKVGGEKKVVMRNRRGCGGGKVWVGVSRGRKRVGEIVKNGKVLGEMRVCVKDENGLEDIC